MAVRSFHVLTNHWTRTYHSDHLPCNVQLVCLFRMMQICSIYILSLLREQVYGPDTAVRSRPENHTLDTSASLGGHQMPSNLRTQKRRVY